MHTQHEQKHSSTKSEGGHSRRWAVHQVPVQKRHADKERGRLQPSARERTRSQCLDDSTSLTGPLYGVPWMEAAAEEASMASNDGGRCSPTGAAPGPAVGESSAGGAPERSASRAAKRLRPDPE